MEGCEQRSNLAYIATRMNCRSACLITLTLAFAASAAAREPRLALHLNGIAAVGELDATARGSFRLLGLDVPASATYALDPALGFDAGLQVDVAGPLGIRASVSRAVRKGAGALAAQLPPLPFGLPSRVDALLPEGRVAETAVHVDAVLSARAGRVRPSALGGATLFDLRARLLERVDITVPGVGPVPIFGSPSLEVSDSPVGWNAGVGVDVLLSRALALGAQLRFSRATATLRLPNVDPIDLDAGGVHAGVGLRLRF
jgi:opacity protein-like surface antigen